MGMQDYLIIGAGLAGLSFAGHALQRNRTFTVYDDDSLHASSVAAGVVNPVVLKRLSGVADGLKQLTYAHDWFGEMESLLGRQFWFPLPVLRRFASVEEQNNWFAAADNPLLAPFLSTDVVHDDIPHVEAPFRFGRVMQTAYVDTAGFVEHFRNWLFDRGMLRRACFDYGAVGLTPTAVMYKGQEFKRVVFADGFGIRKNPFFSYLPLEGTKGEVLLVKSDALALEAIIKTDIFILPLGGGLFRVGATYNWDDKSELPTEKARAELEAKLRGTISCPYQVIDQKAAVRPTVKDRKPLIGTHPEYDRLHLLNGLGTRGVMLGPSMARALIDNIEEGREIERAVNLRRFPYAPGS